MNPKMKRKVPIAPLAVMALMLVLALLLVTATAALAATNLATVSYHLDGLAEYNGEEYWEGQFFADSEGYCTKDDAIGNRNVDDYLLPAAPVDYKYAAVIIKAGSGTNANTIFAESNLASGQTVWADNDGDKVYDVDPPEISHIIFCYSPVYPLTAEKTAAGSYDRTVQWTLAKSVDPDSHTGKAGEDAGSSDWTVVATKFETLGNYQVTGSITVYNQNTFAVPFTIADVLDDGTVASVTCPVTDDNTGTVPAAAGGENGSVTCLYTASPADDSAALNTATINSGNPDVQGATATADVLFSEILIGDDFVDLTDPRFQFDENIGGDTTETFSETFTCPAGADLYENGTYSFTETNTAYLDGDNTDLEDSATVEVTCTLDALVPSKTAAGSYDRTVTWTLDKSVDPASHSGYPGDTFDSVWTVVADKIEVSDNYKVTGDISIDNPAAVTQYVTGVSDVLNVGTVATVDCGEPYPIAIAPLGTLECSYTAVPADDLATLNTATVSATGNADQTATAAVSFTENLIGSDSGTLADDRFNYSETISDDTTVTFDETFECPTARSFYDEAGTYSFYEINEATLNGNINLSDDARVDVDCEAFTVDLLKTTNGLVNSEKDWQFALYIGPDGFGTTAIGSSSTLNDDDGILDFGGPALRPDTTYTVCEVGVPAGWTSFWQLNGSTVIPYNPDADSDPSEDLGNRCVDFGGTVETPVDTGTVFSFAVDNSFPGGDPRTPGYWKNWNRCTGGGQANNADKNGGWEEGYWLLEDVLDTNIGGGIVWDDILVDNFVFTIDSCALAVDILDKRDVVSGKKSASDPLVNLATHLLAAQLNFGAGACTTQDVLNKALAAETLLDKYDFNGTAGLLPKKDKVDGPLANQLASYLDDYNNGMYCGSTTE